MFNTRICEYYLIFVSFIPTRFISLMSRQFVFDTIKYSLFTNLILALVKMHVFNTITR